MIIIISHILEGGRVFPMRTRQSECDRKRQTEFRYLTEIRVI